MTRLDLLCLALLVVSLLAIGAFAIWQAYRRANPMPRLPGPFTSVRGGRHG